MRARQIAAHHGPKKVGKTTVYIKSTDINGGLSGQIGGVLHLDRVAKNFITRYC